MKKNVFLILLFATTMVCLTGCTNNPNMIENDNNNNTEESEPDKNMDTITNLIITIDDKKYNATLEDNETVREFTKILPNEFNMSELNGNEKYVYMDSSFPTNPYNPKEIKVGDIMLYGNNCLVIFYKSFKTSYSYTKIGHIDDLPNLGNGNIIVKIEK